MKKNLLFILLFITHSILFAQPTFEWANSSGDFSGDWGNSITVDLNSNVISTGFFQGTNDFDPGVGVYNLTSAGGQDIYIQKLDSAGNFLWALSFGASNSEDVGRSIKTDYEGNIYVTGEFRGTVDFDPGVGTSYLTATSSNTDIFILKLDSDGALIWCKRIGDSSGDYADCLAVNQDGSINLTGRFDGTVDFDPNAGVYSLTSFGGSDLYVLKLDANGDFLWVSQMGGASGDKANSIVTDAVGNSYSTGYFMGTADFDPGIGVNNISSNGGLDIYLLKLDVNGNLVWSHGIGGNSTDVGYSIDVNENSEVFVTGYFSETTDFDPGVGSASYTAIGANDIFVLKLNSDGGYLWNKQMGSASFLNRGLSISLDTFGDVYSTGYFINTVDMDPGPDVFNLTSDGTNNDIYIQKLDSNGDFVWAQQIGATGDDRAFNIHLEDNGDIFLTGYFSETTDFDPGDGVSNLTSSGASDAFRLKLSQCQFQINFDTPELPDLTDNCSISTPITPTASNCLGTYNGTPDIAFPITTQGTTVVTWTYTNSLGISESQTQNVVIADITAPEPDANSLADINSECEITSLTPPTATDNCAGSITGTHNASFPITASTTITWTYDDSNGNTSTQTQNVVITSIDNTVAQVDGVTLEANASGYNYQWIDCNNGNQDVPGANTQTFVATENGNYAVVIDNGVCSVTSSCTVINSVGIDENTMEVLHIYPNPTNGIITIKTSTVIQKIEVLNSLGQTVKLFDSIQGKEHSFSLPKEDGLYLIKVNNTTRRIVKQSF